MSRYELYYHTFHTFLHGRYMKLPHTKYRHSLPTVLIMVERMALRMGVRLRGSERTARLRKKRTAHLWQLKKELLMEWQPYNWQLQIPINIMNASD